MSAYGTSQWGLDAFGVPPDLEIVHAYAISTHEVVVVLNKPPKDVFGFLVGDVSNANSWEFSIPALVQVLQVVGVRSYNKPLEWVVRCGSHFPESTATVRIKGTSLRDAADHIIGPNDYADFAGVTEQAIATPTALAASKSSARDLANRPTPKLGDDAGISGVLIVKGGDYALMAGAELARKLIIRRLTTTPGEFFHIPKYGVGLRVKEAIPAGDLVRFRALVERELLLEKDIASLTASITQSQNVLSIRISAVLARTGQKVTVALNSPIGQ